MKLLSSFRNLHRGSQVALVTAFFATLLSLLLNPTAPFADRTFSLFQAVLNYYPEDADPEFMLTWVIASIGWFLALSALTLTSLGILKARRVAIVSSCYVIVVLSSFTLTLTNY